MNSIKIKAGRKTIKTDIHKLVSAMELNPMKNGRGWNDDANMSTNALLAYSYGEKPLKDWTKQELMNLGAPDESAKVLKNAIAEFCCADCFHHVGREMKEIGFYSAEGLLEQVGYNDGWEQMIADYKEYAINYA